MQVLDRLFEQTPAALPVARNEDAFRLQVDRTLSELFQSAAGAELYRLYFGEPSEQTLQAFRLYPRP